MRLKDVGDFETKTAPERRRCRFTPPRGQRCPKPFVNFATGLCFVHDRLLARRSAAEAHIIAQELLGDGSTLENRDEVRASMAKLFSLVAEKRIQRPDGALLAYIGSLVLQSLPPRNDSDYGPSDEERAEAVRLTVKRMFERGSELAGEENDENQSSGYPSHNAGVQG